MENWKVKIKDVGYTETREIYIYRRLLDRKIEFFRGDTVEMIDEGAVVKPSFLMTPEMLQEFANALNENGVNPRKEYVEGRLEATEKHLEDMRTLVFNSPSPKEDSIN